MPNLSKDLTDRLLARKLSASNKAAHLVDIATKATSATEDLTFTGDSVATETVTVGDVVITFDTTASATDCIISDLVLSLSEAATAVKELINGEASTNALVTFSGRTPVYAVKATSAAGVVTVTAHEAGAAGNAIASTETCTNASWGAALLSGGTEAVLEAPSFTTPATYADDAAAAVAGVPVGGLYRVTGGNVVQYRAA